MDDKVTFLEHNASHNAVAGIATGSDHFQASTDHVDSSVPFNNWHVSPNDHISATLENLLSLHSANDSMWTARATEPILFNDTGQRGTMIPHDLSDGIHPFGGSPSLVDTLELALNNGNSSAVAPSAGNSQYSSWFIADGVNNLTDNGTIYRSLNATLSTTELATWSDVWLGKPFPSGYTQLAIVILALFLSIIMILIVVGNLLVCISIATEKSLKPVQNWFIASLAVSDLLIGLVIMPFSLARELMGYWMFGQVWCDVHAALDVFLCTASINNLFMISLDRYWSITQAVKYLKKRTPSRAAFMIAFVWILSALVALPPLVAWKKAEVSSELPQCNLSEDIGYVLYSSVGSFYFPALMMVFVYIRIFIAARSRARRHIEKKKMLRIQIQNSNQRHQQQQQHHPQTPPSSESGGGGESGGRVKHHHHQLEHEQPQQQQQQHQPLQQSNNNNNSARNHHSSLAERHLHHPHQQQSVESCGREYSTSTTICTSFITPDNTTAAGEEHDGDNSYAQHSRIPEVKIASIGDSNGQYRNGGTDHYSLRNNDDIDDCALESDINMGATLSPQPKSPPPPQIVIEPSPEYRRQSWNIISTSELISTINISSRDLTPEQVISAERLHQQAGESDGADEPLLARHNNNNNSSFHSNGAPDNNNTNRNSCSRRSSDCELPNAGNGSEALPLAIKSDKNENGANCSGGGGGGGGCTTLSVVTNNTNNVNSNNNNGSSNGRVYFLKNVSRAAAFPFRKSRLNGGGGGSEAIKQRKSSKTMTVDDDSDTADSPTSKEQQHAYESKSFLTAPAKLIRSKFGSSMSIADYEDSDVMEDQDSGSRKGKSGSGKCHGTGSGAGGGTGSGKGAQFSEHSSVLHQPSDAERHKRKIAKARERRATLIVGIIMAAFITAWLPFFVLYVLAAFCMVCKENIPESVFSVAFWAGYCNSDTIFNRDYRKAFRKILFK